MVDDESPPVTIQQQQSVNYATPVSAFTNECRVEEQNPEALSSTAFQNPEALSSTAFQNPEALSSTAFQNPEALSSTAFQNPEANASAAYQNCDPIASTGGYHSTQDQNYLADAANGGCAADDTGRHKRPTPYEAAVPAGHIAKKLKVDLLPVLSYGRLEEYRRYFAPLSRDQILELLARSASVHEDVYYTAKQAADESPSARRLMIRNISFLTENNSLYKAFSQFGTIEDFTIVREKDNNKSKGFGFVTFKSVESVKMALTTPTTLDGRSLIVKLAADTQSEGPYAGPLSAAGYAGAVAGGVAATGSAGNAAAESKAKRKIFIRNLSEKTTTEGLRNAFVHFGAMEDCVVVCDPVTNRSKSYGFITFLRQEDATRAVQQSQRILDGQMTFISFATPSGGGGGYARNQYGAAGTAAAMQHQQLQQQQQPLAGGYQQQPVGQQSVAMAAAPPLSTVYQQGHHHQTNYVPPQSASAARGYTSGGQQQRRQGPYAYHDPSAVPVATRHHSAAHHQYAKSTSSVYVGGGGSASGGSGYSSQPR